MANNGEGPKAIASLVKKPSDVTRQGTQKLKFVPTLPARRKKEEVKQEVAQTSVQSSDKGDGRGRGRGRGRGGEARGTVSRPPPVEMTASGPFSMGPVLAGTSARRSTPKSNFNPIVPQGPAKGSVLGANLTNLAPLALKEDKQRENPLVDPTQLLKIESDDEVYSEPDEGVEIIDMNNVRQLDWMAPETLQKDQRDRRKRKEVKAGVEERSLPSASQGSPSKILDHSTNMFDVNESEEEALEDLAGSFLTQTGPAEEGIRQERLYFFQFPEPFPTFTSDLGPAREMDVDTSNSGPSTLKRKASFAADAKPTAPMLGPAIPPTQVNEASKAMPKVDGVIGHIEIYRSGAVKMRLVNGIVLNVSEATQSSFLQQAVHLDMENKRLHVLGEVNKRFVLSPDLDTLLAHTEVVDNAGMVDDPNLIKMDTV